MANTNETIADIIAEMRGMGNYQRYSGDHARVLANRFEAAHKREIEATAAKCCQLGRLAGYGASEIKHLREPVGDAAKIQNTQED